jgi:hypothetical protein
MPRSRLSKIYLVPAVLVFIFLMILLSLSIPGAGPDKGRPEVYLLYASSGSMPQLLNTGQIDAFIVWEPVVSNAELSGIGKMIATPADLPPPGQWDQAACCVLVLRNDTIERYPDIAALLSALTTAAVNRTNEDPALAQNITAQWVFGDQPILTPTATLDPLPIENLSFANMVFTSGAPLPESGIVAYTVQEENAGPYNPPAMIDSQVSARGDQFLAGLAVPSLTEDIPTVSLGYLPSSDHFAPLYVMAIDSQYFCERYGFCLVPDDPDLSRPVSCTLLVNGSPAAYVELVPGQSGGGLMTAIGQEVLDGSYVGSIPAELQISLGNPSSVIQSINTGGTGLVVGPGSPCNDWDGFLRWVKVRSAAGRPVIVATIQSSIQEDMIRGAFGYENISVILYGTDFKTPYP